MGVGASRFRDMVVEGFDRMEVAEGVCLGRTFAGAKPCFARCKN